MAGWVTSLSTSIDSLMDTYINSTSAQISLAISPLVATGVSIWIMVYGYAVMRQEVGDPVNVFIKNIIKFSIVASIALGTGFYQNNIIGTVNGVRDGLVKVMTTSAGLSFQGNNLEEAIDNVDQKTGELAQSIAEKGARKLPVGGWLDLISSVVIYVGNAFLLVVSAGYFLLSKIAFAFVLSVGPMFIMSLAFPATAKFFDAWLSKVLNYVFLVMILAFGIGLSASVCDSYISHVIEELAGERNSVMADAFGIAAIYITLGLFIIQAPHIASGLAGGASLSGGGAGNFLAGMLVGRRRSEPNKGGGDQGGSIEGRDQGGKPGAPEGGGNNQGSPGSTRVPAYKRAAQRKFGSRK